MTAGDYLSGFFRDSKSLLENNRDSITITIEEVRPSTVGALIALFERAVGLYGELINVNAYHQPGVEAGKKAAATVLDIQQKILKYIHVNPEPRPAGQIAEAIGQPENVETVFEYCASRGQSREGSGESPWSHAGPYQVRRFRSPVEPVRPRQMGPVQFQRTGTLTGGSREYMIVEFRRNHDRSRLVRTAAQCASNHARTSCRRRNSLRCGSRAIYSTDASIYQIRPLGVVIPRTVDALASTVAIAMEQQVPIIPRGGG